MRIVIIILLFSFSKLVRAQTNIHKVIPGESIYTIARLYGTTAPRIAFLNHFDLMTMKLEVGQKIIIPSYYYEVKKKETAPTYKDYTIKAGDNFICPLPCLIATSQTLMLEK